MRITMPVLENMLDALIEKYDLLGGKWVHSLRADEVLSGLELVEFGEDVAIVAAFNGKSIYQGYEYANLIHLETQQKLQLIDISLTNREMHYYMRGVLSHTFPKAAIIETQEEIIKRAGLHEQWVNKNSEERQGSVS